MQTLREALGRHSVIAGIGLSAIAILVFLLMPSFGGSIVAQTPTELVGALLVFAFIALVAGPDAIRPSGQGMKFSFRKAAYMIIIAALLGLLMFSAPLIAGTSLVDGWVLQMLGVIFLCLLVGMFEEGIFRGLVLNGLLGKMGGTRKGMIGAVVISSVLFGFIHVMAQFSNPLSMDALAWGQSIGKTIQTGMMGFLMAAIYLKTRNIWGVVILHGLNDCLEMMGAVLFGASSFGNYVSSDPNMGLAFIAVYLVFSLICIPFIVIAVKILKQIELPCNGFFKDVWSTGEPSA